MAKQRLPGPSDSIPRLCADLDEFGYCLVKNALPSDIITQVRDRLAEQSALERERGPTPLDDVQMAGGDDGNQYVYMLLNKGTVFRELLGASLVRALVAHVLGKEYLLSDFAAIITRPGNQRMGLHIDQWFLPSPAAPGEDQIRAGTITRRNLVTGPPAKTTRAINPPVVCNALWMLSEFTIENGATRLVPGSHLSGHHPDAGDDYDTINVTGPAGTVAVFEGRTWHGADLNRSITPRYAVSTYYCAPQIRQMANFPYGTRPEVMQSLTPELRALLGLKPWGGYGATGDPGSTLITPGEHNLGALYTDDQ